jgi:hypothetical protein
MAHRPAEEEEEVSEIHYDDSSVCQYTCHERWQSAGASSSDGGREPTEGRSLKGFVRRGCGPFGDENLQRIYSIDSGADVLVAGGHGGVISVFAAKKGVVIAAGCGSRV